MQCVALRQCSRATLFEVSLVDKIPKIMRSTNYTAPSPRTVSSAAQEALQNLPNSVGPEDLAAHRAMCERVQSELGAIQLERHQVKMHLDSIAGVPVRIFTPSQMPSNNRDCVLLNLHGGGFTVDAGSVTENVPLAGYAKMTVVAVRYRLAPEHRFPAAVDDALAVYCALLADHTPERIGLYGTSAGACLCSQLLVRLRRAGYPLPRAFGFFTGTADLSRSGDTEFFFRPAGDLTSIEDQFSAYIGDNDRLSATVSPIFSDLKGFPPTLCIAGTRDFMLSQTSLFHQALLHSGVDARLLVFEAMPHAHWIFLDLPESDQAFSAMAGFMESHLNAPVPPRT
jgi:monoterpene epsilon-lactone hydrolase